ncbi:putative cAMP-mediated signaling protein Sok1 [Cladophialophora carrionii]|uniref:Putative cAMP-mediated signaling protein Sok1 n=1 Tax=Cladophialophora carrionii TaxID=86049 RepID=A0A1C1D261_9EURO|nr:putative cAMP-mediated signaling protein Sok1 [Cladophialophora carrionii]
MGKDADDIPDGSSKGLRNTKYSGPATKAEQLSADRSLSATASYTSKSNMPRPAGCTSPQWVLNEDRHHDSRSCDSGYHSLSETRDATPQQVKPGPYKESTPPPSGPRCAGTEDTENLTAIPLCISEADADALLNASPYPPVTKESLGELELTYIQSNVTLRIDINYDHDLHFTPISGGKGEQKKRDARRYWLSLAAELRIVYQHSLLVSCAECDERRSLGSDKCVLEGRSPSFRRRLPALFQKLQELLVILVPEKDQDQISQYLDVSLLLQEVSHGLLDIARLARWLDGLLTSHCAPMRDVSAHEMAEKIRQGAETGDVPTLVAGIETLFQILEAMKLDVANHQIRSFRYLLIDDTVAFQQEFFRSRIGRGNLEAQASRKWYDLAVAKHQQCHVDRQTPRSLPLAVLVHGMLELCLWPDPKLPATLAYDHKRLKEIRGDIQDFVHLDMCLLLFNQLVRELSGPESQSMLETEVTEMHCLLRNRIMDITDGNPEEVSQIWLQHTEAIAVELSRAASLVRLGPAVPLPSTTVAKTAQLLKRMFEYEHQHQHRARQLVRAVEQEAHAHATKFLNMTTLEISHAQKHWQQVRAQACRWRLLPEIEDIARRLAHIASIHWRVWAELVYLDSEDGLELGVDDTASISGDGIQKMTDDPIEFVQHNLHDTPCR